MSDVKRYTNAMAQYTLRSIEGEYVLYTDYLERVAEFEKAIDIYKNFENMFSKQIIENETKYDELFKSAQELREALLYVRDGKIYPSTEINNALAKFDSVYGKKA